jgi:hypothetical protein
MEKMGEVNLEAHLVRMQAIAVAALMVAVGVGVGAFVLPYRGSSVASPLTVTLVAVAGSLWIGFSANRDAAARMEKIRRAFAVHGDEAKLLRDHWLVYAVILVRLEMMVLGGLVVALWGMGPVFGVWLVVLGGLMVVLTWPTSRKSQLLLGRARALRGDV